MNILSVGGSYKPANGGNAKRISTMCRAFVRLGHRVTVYTCSGYSGSTDPEQLDGVTVRRFDAWKSLCAAIRQADQDGGFDVLLVHEETYLRALRMARVRIPVVYECHAIEPNPSRLKEAALCLMRRGYLRSGFVRAVFVLSRNAAESFSRRMHYPAGKIFYTPNGVDSGECAERPMSFGAHEEFVYGYAGTLYEFQGIGMLLRCSQRILDIAPDVKIMIVGGGPMEKQVREYIEKHGLQERVICTGSVEQAEFDRLTDGFDVMLMPRPSMPSTESAVPLKIFDAAIHKKPVVMSDVSGLTEAFGPDAALIYRHDDPDGFVACCEKIYRNGELAQRLVEGERQALLRWPTTQQVAQLQLDVMEKIVQGKEVQP